MHRWIRTAVAVVGSAAVAMSMASCNGSADASASAKSTTLRLGYFPNLTHASALVGVDKEFFAKAEGSTATIKPLTFNAGPAAVEALFADKVDVLFVGPNPTINGFVKSDGKALRVIAGATSGGAALVVTKSITSPAQLRGKRIASPQLGNTQDVALRHWLAGKNLRTDVKGGGDVIVVPQENSLTLQTFGSGQIDGAWVPEPWATRLVKAGGHVLVDESSLWPRGQFVTTNVVVRTAFLDKHPEAVRQLLQGLVSTTDWITSHPTEAQAAVGGELARLTGKALPADVLGTAFSHIHVTVDPLSTTLHESARNAESVGLLKKADLDGLYDLAPLNTVLRAAGKSEVSAS